MAIDVGSNAMKSRIWEIEADGSIRRIDEQRYPVRLGSGAFTTGMLRPEGIEEAIRAFEQLQRDGESMGVHAIRAVATSAVRETSNGMSLVRKVVRRTGIKLEILPAAEEARLIALGSLGAYPQLSDQYIIIDVGGGSTEVILASDPDIVNAQSLRLGAVRLKEMFFPELPPTPAQLDLAERHIQDVLSKVLHLPELSRDLHCLGCAGTVSALKEMSDRLDGGESGKDTLTLGAVRHIIDRIREMTGDRIVTEFGLDLRRAEIILAGALVVRALFERLDLESLKMARGGVSEGLLQGFLERVGLRSSRLFDHDRVFTIQAVALGEHYGFNRLHAKQVSRLALSLFEQLEPVHELDPDDARLLKGAALLHEIGQFISFTAHHKHSYYLICNSDLAGISPQERLMMACIARYHRKAPPKADHEGYEELDEEARTRVRKLAAILRIADALDREHQSLISQLKVRIDPPQVHFQLSVHYQASIEVWNAAQKADLFEDVFGLKPTFMVVNV